MGCCAVRQVILSRHKNDETSQGVSCGSCMRPALVIVAPAHCEKRGLGYGAKTSKPRRVSAILRPSTSPDRSIETTTPLTGTAPLLWRDWSRCQTRREWMRLLRSQRLDLLGNPEPVGSPPTKPSLFSRAQRAHWRMSWQQRLARNARASSAPAVTITLFGLPPAFAASLGLATV